MNSRSVVPLLALACGGACAEVVTFEGTVLDASRGRLVSYLVYYDDAPSSERSPLVLVSHGGTGSATGHLRGGYLGEGFAERGSVAIHIGHRPSVTNDEHLADRPADVSFLLDRLDAGALPLPDGLAARIDLERVGHVGHSYGAYTVHATGGAVLNAPGSGIGSGDGLLSYRDPRIDAVVPLSPQGADQFGFDDHGPADNSWMSFDIPACIFVGEVEVNTNVIGTIEREGWRLEPFRRYPFVGDKYAFVLPGQDHSDLWQTGSPEVQRFIVQNAALFFDHALRGVPVPPDLIGTSPALEGVERMRKSVDFNADTRRNIFDVIAYLDAFNANDPGAETTGDFPAEITIFDLLEFLDAWNTRVSPVG